MHENDGRIVNNDDHGTDVLIESVKTRAGNFFSGFKKTLKT